MPHMEYDVRTVEDHELPEGINRVIVEREDGSAVLLISGDAARCWRFMRAWEATIEPCEVPTLLYAV